MNKLFSEVPHINVPRSVFNRPCTLKTAIGVDYLYPVYVDECLPGDTFSVSAKLFGRLATPVVPIMDDLYLDMFWFAVPYRLVDPNWKKIMGEQTATDPNTGTFSETNCPNMSVFASQATVSSLHDYLGLPIGVRSDVLPYYHRAYNLIYNEWFRDENLCSYVKVGGNLPDQTGTEASTDYVLLKRCKVHDYFTSALPWPQKGGTVSFNIGTSAPIYGTGHAPLFSSLNSSGNLVFGHLSCYAAGMDANYSKATAWKSISGSSAAPFQTNGPTPTIASKTEWAQSGATDTGLYADLSAASAVTVNDLRNAFATQHFLEACARGGSRYIETLLVHFGISTPDSVLQRPEFLGSSSVPLNVNAVPQTSATDSTSPQGNLAAFVTGDSDCHFVKTFLEHSVLMCIANIRATVSYQQGLKRMFSRRSRYDFYWPEFANLGEQPVLNKEIYETNDNTSNLRVFGYQQRYAEYRYNQNMITGRLRSTASESLDVWHLAEKFSGVPSLSQTFVQSNVPLARAIAYTGDVHSTFILDGYFQIKCARPMPVMSVPGLTRL